MNVGTRELKNRLSYYLRRIRRDGESICVTDRGEVIAELRPVQSEGKRKSDRAALLALVAKGEVTPGTGRFKDFRPIRTKPGTSLARIVLADRR